MSRLKGACAAGLAVLLAAAATPALANPDPKRSAPRREPHLQLEHDLALATFRRRRGDPQIPAPTGARSSLWLSITFRRGNMNLDDYLGRRTKRTRIPCRPRRPDAVTGFRDAIERRSR